MSPRRVARRKEGALHRGRTARRDRAVDSGRAATHYESLFADGAGRRRPCGHACYKRGGRYGAIGKTNHATIRFRDPVYRTPRELALSYFHEWFLNTTGKKDARVLQQAARYVSLRYRVDYGRERLMECG